MIGDDSMKWQPWEDYKNVKPVELDIKEPPCKHCRHFKPSIITNRHGEFDGVVICCNDDMYHDFSCYEPKKEE